MNRGDVSGAPGLGEDKRGEGLRIGRSFRGARPVGGLKRGRTVNSGDVSGAPSPVED